MLGGASLFDEETCDHVGTPSEYSFPEKSGDRDSSFIDNRDHVDMFVYDSFSGSEVAAVAERARRMFLPLGAYYLFTSSAAAG